VKLPDKLFCDLIVWQKAHQFVLRTCALTKRFPREERYCLVPQIRRAAFSIPANIAERFKKRGLSDKNRLFNVSQGSLEESRYYLVLSEDLDYGECMALEPLLEDVSRLTHSLRSSRPNKRFRKMRHGSSPSSIAYPRRISNSSNSCNSLNSSIASPYQFAATTSVGVVINT
jgi:four helix bundle protein